MATEKQLKRRQVEASVVRAWARAHGYQVGRRGHLPPAVIAAYNRTHRTVFIDKNPMRKENREMVDA